MTNLIDELACDRLQLFIPEGDRESKTKPVDLHDRWVIRLLEVCGRFFGGATSYGRGVGVWTSGPHFYWDRVTVVEVWADPRKPGHAVRIRRLKRELEAMRRALRQEAVLYIINGTVMLFRGGGKP